MHRLLQIATAQALRETYQDRSSSFSELLNPDKLVSIHYGNIKYLLTEI